MDQILANYSSSDEEQDTRKVPLLEAEASVSYDQEQHPQDSFYYENRDSANYRNNNASGGETSPIGSSDPGNNKRSHSFQLSNLHSTISNLTFYGNNNQSSEMAEHHAYWKKQYLMPALMTVVVLGIVVFIFIMILTFLALAFIFQAIHSKTAKNVLLISIDGFRWDYFDMYASDIPNLVAFRDKGISAEKMRPIYPSKTFPNHYTLVTGLYAESHGIVSNYFYDPVFEEEFAVGHPSSGEAKFWNEGEPIWITLSRNNIKSATVFWPGSDVPIRGEYPTYWTKYDESLTHEDRIKIVFENMDRPLDEKPQFVTLYFSDVDSAGHAHGPQSKEVRDALRRVDASFAEILQGLEDRDLLHDTDILLVSDHGMTGLSKQKQINLSNYVNLSDVSFYNTGPLVDLHLNEGVDLDTIFSQVYKKNPHMAAYKRHEIPDRFHYQFNRRIPDILLVAENGYSITQDADFGNLLGNHGYDNDEEDMKAIFVANGPSFLSGGKRVKQFDNVNVYPLICHLLEAKIVAPNNGSLANVKDMLKKEVRPHVHDNA